MEIFCGTDIIEIGRIKSTLYKTGDAFIKKVFTDNEIEYCEKKKSVKFKSYAARFAAKEAVSKAFGTGISNGLDWKDIEILNNNQGKPYVILTGRAKDFYKKLKGVSISLSLSHCDNYAVAFAVIKAETKNTNDKNLEGVL